MLTVSGWMAKWTYGVGGRMMLVLFMFIKLYILALVSVSICEKKNTHIDI